MDTQDKILESALKIFVERGFSAPTSLITKEAGVSTGILFHYFPTKMNLIITLYSEILSEYYQGTKRLRSAIDEYDLLRFSDIHKDIFWEAVNWSLDHWQKYQYLQLFEGSVIADQYVVAENKEIKDINDLILEVLGLGVQRGIFEDLPTDFMIKNLSAITHSIIEYLHEQPALRNDNAFLEKAWQIYWNTAARS